MAQPQKSAQFIVPLDAAEPEPELVGGKGRSLVTLTRMGLPVPPGFLITTYAYRRFVAANGIQAAIASLIVRATTRDAGDLEDAAVVVRELFEAGAMPDDVAEAILHAYANLPDDEPAVAVRSSATAEDLPDLSFAGQHDSFLNISGATALLDAVRRCWASLWTARAIDYRTRNDIDQFTVAMGVVVQIMVAADVSGVLFTVDPATGNRDELVVNASYGLGEAIVSGSVSPDMVVLKRSSLMPSRTALGEKRHKAVPASSQGTILHDVPETQRGEPALTLNQVREIAALAIYVEQYLGGTPLDLEWALADDRCWILQSRPITTLLPAQLHDVRWEPPPPGTPLLRRQVTEHMPEPLSPLFDELYLQVGLDQSMDHFIAFLGNSPSHVRFVEEYIDRPFFVTVNGYAYSRVGIRFSWAMIPLILHIYATTLPKLLRRWLPYWRDEALPDYLGTVESWKLLDEGAATDQQLIEGIRELAIADAKYWFAASMPIGVAKVTDELFARFLAGVTAVTPNTPGKSERLLALDAKELTSALFLRGFASKAVDAQAELEVIARTIRTHEQLRRLVESTPAEHLLAELEAEPEAAAVVNDLRHYFDRYGHQIYSLDFAVPTLDDEPLPVLINLKALVEKPVTGIHERQAEWVKERTRQEAAVAQALDPIGRLLFRTLLGWAQKSSPYREEAIFYVGAGWPTLRRLALELGRRLTQAGSLARPEDVFYVKVSELVDASNARAQGHGLPTVIGLAHARRELREAQKRLEPPSAVPPDYRFKIGPIDMSLFEPHVQPPVAGASLHGVAVSPGRATAPASVILAPADFHKMVPGTILVCPTTTPAWTPLLAQAAGLVTDIGGVLAHGSIIAREFGIPAVMGAQNATRRIVHGATITVNGSTGAVMVDEQHG